MNRVVCCAILLALLLSGCTLSTFGTADAGDSSDMADGETADTLLDEQTETAEDPVVEDLTIEDPSDIISDEVTGEDPGFEGWESEPCIPPEPPWWNSDWQLRRRMYTDDAPADYTYRLVFDGTTSPPARDIFDLCLESGNDLRIAAWNGSGWTEMDRHLKQFEVESIIILFKHLGPDHDYYMYYNFISAPPGPSDMRSVFLWYDDFNRADGDPGIGTLYGVYGDGTWVISGGRLRQTSDERMTAIYPLLDPVWEDIEIRYLWRPADSGCVDSGPVFHWNYPASENIGYYLERQEGHVVIFDEPDHNNVSDTEMPSPAREDHIHMLRTFGNEFNFYEDGAPVWSDTVTDPHPGVAGLATFCTGLPFTFDHLTIKLYARPEPGFSAGEGEAFHACH